MRRLGTLLLTSLVCVGACSRQEAAPEKRRITSSESTVSYATAVTSASTSNAPAGPAASEVPTPKQVCDRFAALLKKSGGLGKRFGKKLRRCLDTLPKLRDQQPNEYACSARCIMQAADLAAFDACEERCGPSTKDEE